MLLKRYFTKIRNADGHNSSTENDRTHYTSNVTTGPSHALPGRDFVRQPEYSLGTDTTAHSHSLPGRDSVGQPDEIANPEYIYYRIYAEDGAISLKTPVAAGDPFLGRIKSISVPPPFTVKAVKGSIAQVENIKHLNTSIFLTPYSELPLSDAAKVILLPRSTPQEPLALVAKMSDSDRSTLEFERRGGLASAAEPDTTSPEIQYLYYLLYGINYEMPSKVAVDPELPSLGRIRVDSVAPPRSLTSIKRCISRVERNPVLAYADLFANRLSSTPLRETHISILRNDGPGRSPNEPLAIVEVKIPSIPDGKYVIKNRAADIYWSTPYNPIKTVHFIPTSMKDAKKYECTQWDITNDNNGNISMTSSFDPSSWVGAEITGSKLPVPWRLIPADGKFYYLTTDMNPFSQNPQVPVSAAQKGKFFNSNVLNPGSMATLKEGDQRQMWEFIRI